MRREARVMPRMPQGRTRPQAEPGNAPRCDGTCTALQCPMQHAAMKHAPRCTFRPTGMGLQLQTAAKPFAPLFILRKLRDGIHRAALFTLCSSLPTGDTHGFPRTPATACASDSMALRSTARCVPTLRRMKPSPPGPNISPSLSAKWASSTKRCCSWSCASPS